MPAVVVVGAQWGDEGKGKATDQLSSQVDYVVKFNGGNNAGHTVVVGDEKYALHLLPSGILSPGCTPVIANGVVVDLAVLFEELEGLTARGVDVSRLLVSSDAHLIPPYNRTLDKVTERFLGKRQIGTTGRGIGPTYADKMARVGIRVQDLFDENILRQKVEGALVQKNQLLVKVYNRRAVEVDEIVDELLSYADRLQPMVTDTSLVLNQALDEGRTVVFEAGQAAMLDVDHGTYPFVTSSSATAGGACTGSGVGPTRIDRVVGVIKAYTTRVGEGPFPTELLDEAGDWLRGAGGEFGTTTPRRRCSTSTTAPIPASPRPRPPRGVPAPAAAWAPPGSTGSWGSSRPTPRGWERDPSPPSCCTRPGAGCARRAGSLARRRAGRAGAAGTTPSWPGTPAASTGSPTWCSPSSTC